MNLKETRISKGLLQADVAKLINTSIPNISCYESGSMQPTLEEVLILEKELGKMDWPEEFTQLRKHQIVQSLIELYQRYPIKMVASFAHRVFTKTQSGDKLIDHYAEVAMGSRVEPLYPPDITDLGLKQTRK